MKPWLRRRGSNERSDDQRRIRIFGVRVIGDQIRQRLEDGRLVRARQHNHYSFGLRYQLSRSDTFRRNPMSAPMTPIIGTHADIRPRDYRYERQRSDSAYVPFVHSPRYSGWWREAAQAASLVAFMVAAFVVSGGAVWIFGGR